MVLNAPTKLIGTVISNAIKDARFSLKTEITISCEQADYIYILNLIRKKHGKEPVDLSY